MGPNQPTKRRPFGYNLGLPQAGTNGPRGLLYFLSDTQHGFLRLPPVVRVKDKVKKYEWRPKKDE